VIASVQLTNEELFLIDKLFRQSLRAHVTIAVPERPGSSDDFLRKSDKNPNTFGATLLGVADPNSLSAEQLIDDAVVGKIDVLCAFGHDLVELFGEAKVRRLGESVPLLVYSGTNENGTVPLAHWVLPSAAYLEKDGTFVNCHGRLQRIGRAFAPPGDSREDWRFLLELAAKLGLSMNWRGPEELFQALAADVKVFRGLSYESIGDQGVALGGTE
jgi:predicted molibdopterin-dependent oxidoreductase YjgC